MPDSLSLASQQEEAIVCRLDHLSLEKTLQCDQPSSSTEAHAQEAHAQEAHAQEAHAQAGTSLEDLPELVLRRILDFLLTAREVQGGSSYDSTGRVKLRYNFETAIMRTSHTIHDLASEVLASNHFILIRTTDRRKMSILEHTFTRYWTENILSVKHVRMHVLFTNENPSPWMGGTPRTPASWLVCLDDLKDFVLSLQRMDLLMNQSYKFIICLRSAADGQPLSLKSQRSLLWPFCVLKGLGQKCIVTGSVDASLADEVMQAMTPSIFWFRDRHMGLLTVTQHFLQKAHEFFFSGDMYTAAVRYDLAYSFIESFEDFHINFLAADDSNLHERIYDLTAACKTNECLALLNCIKLGKNTLEHDKLYRQIIEKEGSLHFGLDKRYGYQLTLQGEFIATSRILCMVVARVALNILTDRELEAFRMIYVKTYPEWEPLLHKIQVWHKHTARKRAQTCKRLSAELLAFSTIQPLHVSLAVYTPAVSPSIDFERYILKGLGYVGDFYEDIIVQKPGVCVVNRVEVAGEFNKSHADELIESFKRKLEEQKKAGKVPGVRLDSLLGDPARKPSGSDYYT